LTAEGLTFITSFIKYLNWFKNLEEKTEGHYTISIFSHKESKSKHIFHKPMHLRRVSRQYVSKHYNQEVIQYLRCSIYDKMCLVPVKNSRQSTMWIKLKVTEQCQKLKLERNSPHSVIQNYSSLTPILGTSILYASYPYKFHPSLVLMSTTDKIRAAVHIVVTIKIILMYQNITQLSFYMLCSINIRIIVF